MTRHLDDDENVKAMRETALDIGLTALVREAWRTSNEEAVKELLQRALDLLGRRR